MIDRATPTWDALEAIEVATTGAGAPCADNMAANDQWLFLCVGSSTDWDLNR